MAKVFIAIAGNMGSGKTTLTDMLSQQTGFRPHFEPVEENPYLADFYKDMPRYAFKLQVKFLSWRFRDHMRIHSSPESSIQDRTIYEDSEIFAWNLFNRGIMDARDYETYRELADALKESLSPPDILVFIHKSVPVLLRRIEERGRDCERNVSVDYLKRLNHRYEEWYESYNLGRKVMVNADEIDFLHNPEHLKQINSTIIKSLQQPDLFIKPANGAIHALL